VIEVCDLVVNSKYGNARINIPHLHIDSVGITALVGPNGSGKSTLLRVLSGYEKPDKGCATYFSKNTFFHFEDIKSHIHLLSWNISLYYNRCVWEHLKLIKSFSSVWDDALEQELIQDLSVDLRKKISSLSRGEQARVRILLSLPQKPSIILVDEVTNELDIDSRRLIFQKLDAYSFEKGGRVIAATNMVDDIERYATQIILLKSGRVLLNESLDSLKEKHANSLEEIIRYYDKQDVASDIKL
jgi:ABC-2 type transport system ATP-binding protein